MSLRRCIFAIAACLSLSNPGFAQIRSVQGEYTYYADANQSLSSAKLSALENARVQALAREFGTVITQSTTQNESAVNGREQSYFLQLNASEVKGEWLEDTRQPEYDVQPADDMLVVTCRVWGRARPLSNEATDFEALVLRNGTERRFADTRFHSGDDLFLSFRSPVSGYVAVYLVDESPTAFCLLPYISDTDGQQTVEAGREYVFFSPATADKGVVADEFALTCSGDVMERNQLYVVFSPQPFTKAVDSQLSDALPRQLDFADFTRWLTKCRKRDPRMGMKVIHLNIENAN